MPIIRDYVLILVLQKKRIKVESVFQMMCILCKHCRAVNIHKQPFLWVETKGVSKFNTRHEVPELWAYQSTSCVGSINMEPYSFSLTDWAKLTKVVIGATCRCSESCNTNEWYEAF